VREHWEDMLRVAGSLWAGTVRAFDLLRMITSGDRSARRRRPHLIGGRLEEAQ